MSKRKYSLLEEEKPHLQTMKAVNNKLVAVLLGGTRSQAPLKRLQVKEFCKISRTL
jgi:hypothetical protein